MPELQTWVWTYPWDVLDEGISPVLDNIQLRAGIGGVNLALSYHSGLFLLPHNPKRKIYFPSPGVYFKPDAARYAGLRIQPAIHELAETDLLPALRSETARRGMALNAWAVCLHNTGLGTAHPDCTIETPFGDRLLMQLCPTHPDVRAYIAALVGDLLNRDLDAVLVESLEFMGLPHGYHHEVLGVPLTPLIAWLLGLCFCPSCRQGAQIFGVDVEPLRSFVRDQIERFFGGDLDAGREGIAWPEIKELAGGELGAYHEFRIHVVTSLFEQVRSARTAGSTTRLEACDFGPLWGLGPDGKAWESGFDLHGATRYLDALHPCPYFVSAGEVRRKMGEYRRLAPAGMPLYPAIRSIPPQVLTAQDLREKLEACDPAAVAGFTFYHYGFMRLTTLDWIAAALAEAGSR